MSSCMYLSAIRLFTSRCFNRQISRYRCYRTYSMAVLSAYKQTQSVDSLTLCR